jgi:hypothetical protein
VDVVLTTLHLKKISLIGKVQKNLEPGQILWAYSLSDRMEEISVLERKGSLMAVSRELSKCKLDLVRVQEVRWESGGSELAGE